MLTSNIGAMAAMDLQACTVLHRLGVQFATDADATLAEACAKHGWNADAVAAELGAGGGPVSCSEQPPALDEACQSVVRAHHKPLRTALDELQAASECLERAHGARFPDLSHWRRRLESLGYTLIDHFDKEENAVFPLLALLAAARRAGPPGASPDVEVSPAIGALEAEHRLIESDLAWLRQQAAAAVPPPSAVADWQACGQRLARFAEALRAHARFEDEVLFARALVAERMPA